LGQVNGKHAETPHICFDGKLRIAEIVRAVQQLQMMRRVPTDTDESGLSQHHRLRSEEDLKPPGLTMLLDLPE
jgi:hypothetical protein